MPRAKAPVDWTDELLETKKGDIRSCAANMSLILARDPSWDGILAWDEWAETVVTLKVPPWRECDAAPDLKPGEWTEADTTRLQSWCSWHHNVDFGETTTWRGTIVAAMRKRVHPVKDWLDGLRWDGRKRAPTWLADVLGVEDTPLARAVGTAWLVSSVARIYQPGCKVDTVLVLEGKPGIFKSSVLRALVGDPWFLEMSVSDIANKDAMQCLRRKWIGEFPEFDGYSKSEQSAIKSFLSRQVDTYRESYGHKARDFPRQFVGCATTNKTEYVVDETGGTGRRLWPFQCARGDVAMARALREQLWAEARARYESGEAWHIVDPELRDDERAAQDLRFRPDAWEEKIAAWLAKPADIGPSKSVRGVTTADILGGAILLDVGRWDNGHSARVGAVLRRLGWHPGKHPETRDGVRVRVYRPGDSAHSGTNGTTLYPLETPAPPTIPVPEHTSGDLFPPDEAMVD